MGGAVILNWVLGAIIFVAIVGGGVYAIFRHGKAGRTTRRPASTTGRRPTQMSRPWVSTCLPNRWPPRMA